MTLSPDGAWDLVLAAARAAMAGEETFASVKWGRRYRIAAVDDQRIEIERLDATDPTTLSPRGVATAIGRVNAAAGRARRATVITTVAKETALVHLHPRLRWSDDGDWIETVPPTGEEAAAPPVYRDFGRAPDDDPERLQHFARRVRAGQPAFRRKLLAVYGGRCAVSGWGPDVVLEAAHVLVHARSGLNHVDNGLLLRADLHTLFDDGLLRVHPDTLAVSVHPSLHATPYAELDGRPLRPRLDGGRPGRDYLQWKWDQPSRPSAG
jgi:hypothetical protein